jgi:phage/conjugal plasmid C-4 type zinc finger TraR family protein
MGDNADIANDLMQERLDQLLQNRSKPSAAISATECEECFASIPEDRRIALPGIQTCVECAQLIADKNRFKLCSVLL